MQQEFERIKKYMNEKLQIQVAQNNRPHFSRELFWKPQKQNKK